jgi:hypothetical protein
MLPHREVVDYFSNEIFEAYDSLSNSHPALT